MSDFQAGWWQMPPSLRLDYGQLLRELRAAPAPAIFQSIYRAWFVRPRLIARERRRWARDPGALVHHERRVTSQNGEDGILAELFRRIGEGGRWSVEIGSASGVQNNTRQLLERGWQGLWLDASESEIAQARTLCGHLNVQIAQALVTAENVVSLLEAFGVPLEPDLLSIDIDGNDFWIWQALARYRPRVVVIEYDSAFLPDEDWVMPYNAHHRWDGSSRSGASLAALVRLGTSLGYRLVACDSIGVNAFFVREDLADGVFPIHRNPVEYHYACPKYRRLFFGHPPGMDVSGTGA